jgi:hypothetical protein
MVRNGTGRSQSSRNGPSQIPFLCAHLEEGHTELHTPLHQRSAERLCFICLDGTESEESTKLVQCCTRCFAMAHSRCWSDWRRSQANHARRSRLAGNRISTDPFVCSICKSGSARLRGERVSIRWLESFAYFGSASSHSVRFASGLFSALTGARNERNSPDESSEVEEEDFLDSFEEGGLSFLSELVGDVRIFFSLNILLIFGLIMSVALANYFGFMEGSFVVMGAILAIIAYIFGLAAFIFFQYQRLLNRRQITNE